MIEYNYEIARTNGKKIDIYKPMKIPRVLPNCVGIIGNNSIGKSTLLNIISAGFYGMDNEKIHPVLRKKINNMMNSAYQKLTFQIKIKNRDNTLEIVSEKLDQEKPEVTIREIINGKSGVLSSIEFRSKYNLIYDIPENPTDRLKEFAREIQDTQRTYASRLQWLNEFIRKNISEINNKDPKRILELESQYDKLMDNNTVLFKETELYENQLKLLEYAMCVKYKEEYYIKLSNTELILKRSVKIGHKEEKINKEYNKLRQDVKNKLDRLKLISSRTISLLRKLVPKNEEYNLDMWEKLDIYSIGDNLKIDNDFMNLIVKFRTIVTGIHDNNKDTFQKAELFQDLRNALEPYGSSDIILLGTELSVVRYIEMIDQWMVEHKNFTEDNGDIKNCIDLLDQLKMQLNELEKIYFPKIKEIITDKIGKEDGINRSMERSIPGDAGNINQLKQRLEIYQEKYDLYSRELSRIGVIPDNNNRIGMGELLKYAKFSEDDLSKEIRILRENIFSKKARHNYNSGIMARLKSDIDGLKRQKSNKYENNREILDRLLLTTESLERKFRVDFQSYIEKISKGTYSKKEEIVTLSVKQKDYYKSLFSYLGKRVDVIRHVDKEYKVESIDLINNCFTSREGETINFLDMGTGQGQLAYLLGLLNTQDNRKIILLLDEVAMMDNTTLGFVNEKIRELYNEDRLLIAIVVQAQREGDKVEVSEI